MTPTPSSSPRRSRPCSSDVPDEFDGQVKRELFQSVLEVATNPCATVAEAAAELTGLRGMVAGICENRGLLLGAAGTHPTARWEDQKIVERERYMELAAELGYIARRELIFGMHVHFGIGGPRSRRLCRRRHPPLPAAAARALGEFAVLARAATPAWSRPAHRSSAHSRASGFRPTTAAGRSTHGGSS